MAWNFRRAAPRHRPDAEYTYGVFGLFFNGTRQRRDTDNMLKLILDALNKVAWADDDQVVEIAARKRQAQPGQARTEVLVYRIGTVERNLIACAHCGKKVDSYKSRPRKFCSSNCRNEFVRAKARKSQEGKKYECQDEVHAAQG